MKESLTRPLVSIVILSWNTLGETKDCIASIEKLNYENFEIIIVDNGSDDGSKDYLSSLGKKIKYIDLPENTGFTGGQIVALEHTNGIYIALVNSDAVVARDWLTILVEDLESDNKLAAVGGKSYNFNEENEPYNTNNSYYAYQVIDPKRGYGETLQIGNNKSYVNSISGAGVVIRKTAVDELGYFDNSFFAYYEETDLFARFKRAGYEIGYNPDAHIWHKIAASSKGSSSSFYLTQMEQNRYRFAYKNFDFVKMPSLLTDYWLKFLKAGYSKIRGRNDKLQTARYNAGVSNLRHALHLARGRRKIQKTGSSYTNLLYSDANEKVTVVIPCYNYAEFITDAIESVLAQTIQPAEIIVINDGSTDKSIEKINKYKDRVTVVNQKNNGIVYTKNLGMSMVKTEWVVFLDADDVLQKSYLESVLRTSRDYDADVIYTDMEFFGARQMHFKAKKFSGYRLRIGNFIHNSALIRTTKIQDLGGYKVEMASGYEDWELYVSLFERGSRFKYDKDCEPLLYRQHETHGRNKGAQDKEKKLRETIEKLHPGFLAVGFSASYLREPKELMRYIKHRVVTLPYRPGDIKFRLVRVLVRFDTFLEFKILPRAKFLGKPVGFIRMLLRGEIRQIFGKLTK